MIYIFRPKPLCLQIGHAEMWEYHLVPCSPGKMNVDHKLKRDLLLLLGLV